MQKKDTKKKQIWGDIEIDDKFKEDLIAWLERIGQIPKEPPKKKR